jgi:hypothetical protein
VGGKHPARQSFSMDETPIPARAAHEEGAKKSAPWYLYL